MTTGDSMQYEEYQPINKKKCTKGNECFPLEPCICHHTPQHTHILSLPLPIISSVFEIRLSNLLARKLQN